MARDSNLTASHRLLLGILAHCVAAGVLLGMLLLFIGVCRDFTDRTTVGTAYWCVVITLVFGGFLLNFLTTFWILILSGYESIVPDRQERESWLFFVIYFGVVANVVFYWRFLHQKSSAP